MTQLFNVADERYCPRAETWNHTVKLAEYPRCAECNEPVIYNPTLGEGAVRLICIDCLNA